MVKIPITWFFLGVCLLASCEQQEDTLRVDSLPACFEDRATVQVINQQDGTVQYEDGALVILVKMSNEQLVPCNLPDTFQENDKVRFSGNKKEIFPNERRAGQPFELTYIEKTGEETSK